MANPKALHWSAKVLFITGGTAGMGRNVVLTLAKHQPDSIFFTGRNSTAANELISQVREISPDTVTTFIECDHASLSSVRAAAQHFLSVSNRLDFLICNAGILGTPPALTKDGFEMQWGVNYLAHALFIKLLLPALSTMQKPSPDARIVLVTSDSFRYPPRGGIVFDTLRSTQEDLGFGARFLRYGQSKLALILLGKQLATRYPEALTVCVHPGTVMTGLFDKLPWALREFVRLFSMADHVSLEKATGNICWPVEVSAEEVRSGMFVALGPELMEDSEHSADEKLALRLWEWTEDALKPFVG